MKTSRFSYPVLLLCNLLALSSARALSPFVEWTEIAGPGDVTDNGFTLESIDPHVSINEWTRVAVVGNYEDGSDVLVSDHPRPSLKDVTCSVLRGRRTNYDFPQINNLGQVVIRELWSGKSAVMWMDIHKPGFRNIVADTLRGAFSQLTLPVIANQTSGGPPFIAYLGREEFFTFEYDVNFWPFNYWLYDGGGLNSAWKIADLAGRPLHHLRSMIAEAGARTLIISYGVDEDDGRVVVWRDPEDSLVWEPTLLASTRSGDTMTRSAEAFSRQAHGPFFAARRSVAGPWTAPGRFPSLSTQGIFAVFGGSSPDRGLGIYLTVLDGSDGFPATPFKVLGTEDLITYNEIGKPVFFRDFDFRDNWVLVLHQRLGLWPSLEDDVLTVAFVGTPTEASRRNPAAADGRRLLFTDQPGLWVLRVDVERQKLDPYALDFVPAEAIPLVQVGDRVGTAVVTGVSLGNRIVLPQADEDGRPRIPVRGEFAVALTLQLDTDGNGDTDQIRAFRAVLRDSDQDGLPEHWERRGIDTDGDGSIELDLPALGADPFRRDLFLEVDWLNARHTGVPEAWENRLIPGVGSLLEEMFADAPLLNPDGSTGITLHLDAGRGHDAAGLPLSLNMGTDPRILDGGEEINWGLGDDSHLDVVYFGLPDSLRRDGLETYDLHRIKDVFFGTRNKWAREFAFRYAVLVDFVDVLRDDLGRIFVGQPTSASAETLTCSTARFPDLEGWGVKITAGRGAGQLRLVFSNTPTRLTLSEPWDETPDSTSEFVLLAGNAGEAEERIDPPPGLFSRPGNDLLIALAPYGVNAEGTLGNAGAQFRILANLLGRTLGLLPGGNDLDGDKPPELHVSVMNHNHLFDYETGADTYTDEEWLRLRFDLINSMRCLGNSFHGCRTELPPTFEPTPILPAVPPQTYDRIPPGIVITEPDDKCTVGYGLGSSLDVRVQAWDNVALSHVLVLYDANGDGLYASTDAETKLASWDTVGGDYRVTFADINGALSVRKVIAYAYDTSRNRGVAVARAVAGGIPPDAQTLLDETGSFGAEPSWELGGERQSVTFDGIVVPGSGILTFSVTSTPPLPVLDEQDWREDANVAAISFNGTDIQLRPVATPPEIDPAFATSSWQAPVGGGLIDVVLSGPAAYDVFDRFLAQPIQGYAVLVRFLPRDLTPPGVEVITPGADAFVGLGQTLHVEVDATDDYELAELTVRFDRNGDGDSDDDGETVPANPAGRDAYTAAFQNVIGEPGVRSVTVTATDQVGHSTTARASVHVKAPDLTPPAVRILVPDATATYGFSDTITVEIQAADDTEMHLVTAVLDLNGNGETGDAGETVVAQTTTPGSYRASFAGLSGPSGPRVIRAVARDVSGNEATADVPVTIAGVVFPEENLLHLTGSFPKTSGVRGVRDWGPVAVPYSGRVRVVVSGTPPWRDPVHQVGWRRDSECTQLSFNGDGVTQFDDHCSTPGEDPSVCTRTYHAPGAGSLSGRIEGPMSFNDYMVTTCPFQEYTIDVLIERVDTTLPTVAVQTPARGAAVPLDAGLVVDITCDDDVEIASVIAVFDADGDGATAGLGESVVAQALGRGLYRATFHNVSGKPGARRLETVATDTSLNRHSIWVTYGVGDVGTGEEQLATHSGNIPYQQGWHWLHGFPERIVIPYGPLDLPRSGRLTFRVLSSPNVRLTLENMERYDSMVKHVTFDGQRITLSPVANPPGSDPAIVESVWDAPGPGALSYELLGPMTYNSSGEPAGHRAQDYTLEVFFRPGPSVTELVPGTGTVAGGESVRVLGSGFGENALVFFGDVPGRTLERVGAGELVCSPPPGVPGAVRVRVLNNDTEGQHWNYPAPYGLFGDLADGFTYEPVGETPVTRGPETLVTTLRGRFETVRVSDWPKNQKFLDAPFTIPAGGGWLHFETWAFPPILNAIPGPDEDPGDLWRYNNTSHVSAFWDGSGSYHGLAITSTEMNYPFSPVLCESRTKVAVAAAGDSNLRIYGSARFSAYLGDLLDAPAQDWAVAVWFSATDVTFVRPAAGTVWLGDVTETITWETVGPDSAATLFYSTTGGSTWTFAAELAGLHAEHCLWRVPNPASALNNCRLRAVWPSGEAVSPRFTILPTSTATLSLQPGWNAISLPLQPVDPDVDAILSDSVSDREPDQANRASGARAEWRGRVWTTLPDGSPGYEPATTMEAIRGYWIYATAPGNIGFRGTQPPAAVLLVPGWNLVGMAAPMPVPDVGNAIEGRCWGWATDTQRYAPLPPDTRGAMQPGTAAWIYATDAVSIPTGP